MDTPERNLASKRIHCQVDDVVSQAFQQPVAYSRIPVKRKIHYIASGPTCTRSFRVIKYYEPPKIVKWKGKLIKMRPVREFQELNLDITLPTTMPWGGQYTESGSYQVGTAQREIVSACSKLFGIPEWEFIGGCFFHTLKVCKMNIEMGLISLELYCVPSQTKWHAIQSKKPHGSPQLIYVLDPNMMMTVEQLRYYREVATSEKHTTFGEIPSQTFSNKKYKRYKELIESPVDTNEVQEGTISDRQFLKEIKESILDGQDLLCLFKIDTNSEAVNQEQEDTASSPLKDIIQLSDGSIEHREELSKSDFTRIKDVKDAMKEIQGKLNMEYFIKSGYF